MYVASRLGNIIGPGTAGAPALAANVLCCCFGALSSTFLFLASVTWNEGRDGALASGIDFRFRFLVRIPLKHDVAVFEGIIASALFAFSPLVWEYSNGAEVFALNNALLAALLFLTAKASIL